MDLEAMTQLEDFWSEKYGKETFFQEVMEKAMRGSIKHARSILWASLLRYQPEAKIEDVSGISFLELQKQMGAVAKASAPDEQDLKEAGVKAGRPRKAQVVNGTGATSTSRPGASA